MNAKDLEGKRFKIYPSRTEKTIFLMNALNKKSVSDLVDYLIECADIQQLTKITFENKKTNKKFSTIRSSPTYKPKEW